jgi:hypothetical protein
MTLSQVLFVLDLMLVLFALNSVLIPALTKIFRRAPARIAKPKRALGLCNNSAGDPPFPFSKK